MNDNTATPKQKFFEFVPNAYPDQVGKKLSIRQLTSEQYEIAIDDQTLMFNEHVARLLANFFIDSLTDSPVGRIVTNGPQIPT